MGSRLLFVSLAGALALTGCVIVPTAPGVMALPGTAKSFDEFRADDVSCRQYAQYSLGPGAEQVAANAATANAVGGTVLGAAAGAIIGSGRRDRCRYWTAFGQRGGSQHGRLFLLRHAAALRHGLCAMHVRARQPSAVRTAVWPASVRPAPGMATGRLSTASGESIEPPRFPAWRLFLGLDSL